MGPLEGQRGPSADVPTSMGFLVAPWGSVALRNGSLAPFSSFWASLAKIAPVLGHLGPFFGPKWAILGQLGPHGPPGGPEGPVGGWAPWGQKRPKRAQNGRFGPVLGRFRAIFGPKDLETSRKNRSKLALTQKSRFFSPSTSKKVCLQRKEKAPRLKKIVHLKKAQFLAKLGRFQR